MNEKLFSDSLETRNDITDILLRLFYLRRRFRGKMPEHILNVKASIQEHNLREKIGQINDHYVFFTIGFVFSRQSEPITMGDLSRILGAPFSTATRTVDWLVDNGYVQRLADPAPQPEEAALLRESETALLSALRKLKPQARDLLGLKYGSGLSNPQIAALTGLSEGNVAVILHRAVEALHRILEPGQDLVESAPGCVKEAEHAGK